MTYATPELLLVGAAQNLVLNECGAVYTSDVHPFSCGLDNPLPDEFDVEPGW